ncbi:hypothetical protein [Desulforamulus aquiferis]|uniref:Uncharacterized protein n=1 Tax=Desulforamulus aquiferis TaxID=1397668 RepID=A0AAW7ZGN4_9FIRM|nr:hypothetical protein [Desulforamulus aquiferis]MDO7788532.1 hypothetical protein [Desulforamulus aquiferis]
MTDKIKRDTNISRLHDLVVFQKIRDAKKKPRKTLAKKSPEIITDSMGQMIFYDSSGSVTK